MKKYLSITNAEYINDYKIKLIFNDNTTNLINFENFILNSHHNDIKKYQDKNLFKNFNLKNGDLQWNDYDLAFPIYDLYKGHIS